MVRRTSEIIVTLIENSGFKLKSALNRNVFKMHIIDLIVNDSSMNMCFFELVIFNQNVD